MNNSFDFFDAIFDSKFDTHDLLADNDNLTESTLSDIAKVAAERGYGSLTGNGFEKLTQLLARSKVSWKRHLRKCLSIYVHGSGVNRSHSWTKSNRRELPLPGRMKAQWALFLSIPGPRKPSGIRWPVRMRPGRKSQRKARCRKKATGPGILYSITFMECPRILHH